MLWPGSSTVSPGLLNRSSPTGVSMCVSLSLRSAATVLPATSLPRGQQVIGGYTMSAVHCGGPRARAALAGCRLHAAEPAFAAAHVEAGVGRGRLVPLFDLRPKLRDRRDR